MGQFSDSTSDQVSDYYRATAYANEAVKEERERILKAIEALFATTFNECPLGNHAFPSQLAKIVSNDDSVTALSDFELWLKIGRDNKWISKPVCDTHDGLPMTEDEQNQWEEGNDPCVHALRLYSSPEDFVSAQGDK